MAGRPGQLPPSSLSFPPSCSSSSLLPPPQPPALLSLPPLFLLPCSSGKFQASVGSGGEDAPETRRVGSPFVWEGGGSPTRCLQLPRAQTAQQSTGLLRAVHLGSGLEGADRLGDGPGGEARSSGPGASRLRLQSGGSDPGQRFPSAGLCPRLPAPAPTHPHPPPPRGLAVQIKQVLGLARLCPG